MGSARCAFSERTTRSTGVNCRAGLRTFTPSVTWRNWSSLTTNLTPPYTSFVGRTKRWPPRSPPYPMQTANALVAACERAVNVDGGFFIGHQDEWPLPVGVPHFSGRFLRPEEHQWLLGLEAADAGLCASLMDAGLLLRPGFKYGCRWRAYEEDIEVATRTVVDTTRK